MFSQNVLSKQQFVEVKLSVYIENVYLSTTESDKKSNKATYSNDGTQFEIVEDYIDIPYDNKVQSGKQGKCLLNTVSFLDK